MRFRCISFLLILMLSTQAYSETISSTAEESAQMESSEDRWRKLTIAGSIMIAISGVSFLASLSAATAANSADNAERAKILEVSTVALLIVGGISGVIGVMLWLERRGIDSDEQEATKR
jgi:hypothetical protein